MRVLSFALATAVGALLVRHLPELLGPAGPLPPLATAALLLTPALPLARIAPRELIAAGAALLCGGADLLVPGTAGAALTVAAAGVFLVQGFPVLAQRPLAAGIAAGAVLAHPLFTPLAAAIAASAVLAGSALLLKWRRAAAVPLPGGVERRGQGLRLRGSLALGAGLLMVVQLMAAAPTLPRAAVLIAGGLLAVALLLGARLVPGRRTALAALGGATGAAALAAGLLPPPIHAIAAAVALAGVLLLIARGLVPAPGRRPGVFLSVGLLLTWGLLRLPRGWEGIGMGIAAALLTAAVLLLPRAAQEVDPEPGSARVG